jgi:chromosome segregation ATPase
MDNGRIGDEMTLAGIAKRLDEISTQLGSIQSDVKSHDAKLQSLDGKFQSLDGKFQSLDGKFQSLDSKFQSHDGKFQSLDGKFQSLDGKLTALDHKMTIEFEETRRVVKLGFESVEMLDEKIDRRFDDTDRAHADHKSVLEAALVSLRRDTSKPRRPGRRR